MSGDHERVAASGCDDVSADDLDENNAFLMLVSRGSKVVAAHFWIGSESPLSYERDSDIAAVAHGFLEGKGLGRTEMAIAAQILRRNHTLRTLKAVSPPPAGLSSQLEASSSQVQASPSSIVVALTVITVADTVALLVVAHGGPEQVTMRGPRQNFNLSNFTW